jgi:hypothetical protein
MRQGKINPSEILSSLSMQKSSIIRPSMICKISIYLEK